MTKRENLADDPAKFYDCTHVLVLTGIPWPELVAMESRGDFPKRANAPGDIWHRDAVDQWLRKNDL